MASCTGKPNQPPGACNGSAAELSLAEHELYDHQMHTRMCKKIAQLTKVGAPSARALSVTPLLAELEHAERLALLMQEAADLRRDCQSLQTERDGQRRLLQQIQEENKRLQEECQQLQQERDKDRKREEDEKRRREEEEKKKSEEQRREEEERKKMEDECEKGLHSLKTELQALREDRERVEEEWRTEREEWTTQKEEWKNRMRAIEEERKEEQEATRKSLNEHMSQWQQREQENRKSQNAMLQQRLKKAESELETRELRLNESSRHISKLQERIEVHVSTHANANTHKHTNTSIHTHTHKHTRAYALSSMRLELQRAHAEEIRRLHQEVEKERGNDRQELEEEKKRVQHGMEEEKVRLKEQLRKALEEVIRKHASELRQTNASLEVEKKKNHGDPDDHVHRPSVLIVTLSAVATLPAVCVCVLQVVQEEDEDEEAVREDKVREEERDERGWRQREDELLRVERLSHQRALQALESRASEELQAEKQRLHTQHKLQLGNHDDTHRHEQRQLHRSFTDTRCSLRLRQKCAVRNVGQCPHSKMEFLSDLDSTAHEVCLRMFSSSWKEMKDDCRKRDVMEESSDGAQGEMETVKKEHRMEIQTIMSDFSSAQTQLQARIVALETEYVSLQSKMSVITDNRESKSAPSSFQKMVEDVPPRVTSVPNLSSMDGGSPKATRSPSMEQQGSRGLPSSEQGGRGVLLSRTHTPTSPHTEARAAARHIHSPIQDLQHQLHLNYSQHIRYHHTLRNHQL
uniref:Uncharacterized protein n=1 Tax=Pygocentrus nattereri TaxID=42514 RepID=A0AAR2JZB1_PYGNA